MFSFRFKSLIGVTLATTLAAFPAWSQEGLTLVAPLNSNDTYLVDRSGVPMHSWSSQFEPGLMAEVDLQGNLWRAIDLDTNQWSGRPGSGGGIEKFNWDGTLEWQVFISDNTYLQHHDIEIMPNGNILIIAWENYSISEAESAGRNLGITTDNIFAPDIIMEIRPESFGTGKVVWEWRVWDHLIQDFDSTKANYGNVSNHPELIDINYPPSNARAGDWTHINSIDYDPISDRILLSCKHFNEIWVIDHNTTKSEAAGPKGDLLYRWGNPEAYKRGTAADKKLFGQHDAQWIPNEYPGAGDFLIFNNGQNRPAGLWSSVEQISPPLDVNGNFVGPGTGSWGPASANWSWSDGNFFSNIAGGCQRLRSGNTIISNAGAGEVIEVDQNGNQIWSWTNSFTNANSNSIFKVRNESRMLWPGELTASLSVPSIELTALPGTQHAGKPLLLIGEIVGAPHHNYRSWSNVDGTGKVSFQLPTNQLPPTLIGRSARFMTAITQGQGLHSDELTINFVP